MTKALADQSPTVVARLVSAEGPARQILDALAENFESPEAVVGAFETGKGEWTVAIHFLKPPNETAVRALVALAAGPEVANRLSFERIAAKDWVKASLDGLPPVEAGRFTVHGAHDRARVRVNRIGIEIEAALAFGTGHHGTTRGCLIALDTLIKTRSKPCRLRRLKGHGALPTPLPPHSEAKRRGGVGGGGILRKAHFDLPPIPTAFGGRPSPPPKRVENARKRAYGGGRVTESHHAQSLSRILDVGTGSGVLAIAASRALRARVLASDIDPSAVAIARDNARRNRAAAEFIHANGVGARRVRTRRPFDLVFANILLVPLQRMAAPLARLAAPGARVVLSGLLPAQANAALAAYRAQGLALERRILLDGWATLVLRRGC